MIDWDRISELQTEVGEDGLSEVVEIFFEEMDDAVAALQAASGQGPLSEALHFLKGSAQNLGMSRLSELCAVQEAEARTGARTEAGMPDIVAALRAAREELQAVIR